MKRINKDKKEAIRDEKEINRLKDILIKKFLQKANDTSTEIHQQIFFSAAMVAIDTEKFIYPKLIDKNNLSISVVHYNYSWNLSPVSADSLNKLEGYRIKELNAIVSIPLYASFHKGYEINSISFFCKLSEDINWRENENNQKLIEQLPTYSKTYDLQIKEIGFNE